MLVRQSTYDSMKIRALLAEAALRQRLAEWNALVARVNPNGGEEFLNNARLAAPAQFTADDLAKLIMLCHPDKHDGKPMANEMTAKLLALKGAL